jgi:MATE family multidrug resistance protein
LKKKLNREILVLAIPNIISNISVPLISSVDTALMGNSSKEQLAAIGVGGMLFNFLYWNFGFLRMGTTGMTAQAYGAGERVSQVYHLGRALLLAIVFGSLLWAFQLPLQRLGFYLMNVEAVQQPMVGAYFEIRIMAAPLTLSLMAMMGWFFGMQNAYFPLFLTIIINIANIFFSSLFVIGYDMGIAGVAWGTVIAQGVGVLGAFVLFLVRYCGLIRLFDRIAFWSKRAFRGFFEINSDIFLRTFCLTIAFGFFYSQSGAVSLELLAINTILLQFLNWMSFGVDGFAYAAESLVGKYKGKKDRVSLSLVIQQSMYWGMGLALLYSIVYLVGGELLLGIFTDEAPLIDAAQSYLWWMVLLPIIGTPCYIWDGIFVGLTASKSMRNSMFVALIAYFGVYYGVGSYWNSEKEVANLLWLAMLMFLAVRGFVQYWMYRANGLDIK